MDPLAQAGAKAVTQRGLSYVKRRTLGETHERALETVREQAIGAVIREIAAGTAAESSPMERTAADNLVSVLSRGLPEAGALLSVDLSTQSARTRAAADILVALKQSDDIDIDSIGLDASDLLQRFLLKFSELLASAAMNPETALFSAVAITNAQHANHQLDALTTALTRLPKAVADVDYVRTVSSPAWLGSIKNLYPTADLVNFLGTEWPFIAYPAPESTWEALETPIGSLLSDEIPPQGKYPDDLWPEGRTVFQALQTRSRSDKRVWNGPTFTMEALHQTPDGVKLDLKTCRYFAMAASCDFLETELRRQVARDLESPVPRENLAARQWAHDHAQDHDPIASGRGRSAAASIAVTFVIPHKDGFRAFLSPRSDQVLAHPLFNHVLPSGILAPLEWSDDDLRDELSVEKNLLREYSEELFSNESLDRGDRPGIDLRSEPEIARLLEARENGQLAFYYTGVTFNLLSLRPEICLLIFVRDPEWYPTETERAARIGRPIKPGWEWLSKNDEHMLPETRKHMLFLSLDSTMTPIGRAAAAATDPASLVGNAAACLSLGLGVAQQIT